MERELERVREERDVLREREKELEMERSMEVGEWEGSMKVFFFSFSFFFFFPFFLNIFLSFLRPSRRCLRCTKKKQED